MTCFEKLKLERREFTENQIYDMTRSYCPFELGIDYPPEKVCRHSRCRECWNTEIPETIIKKENDIMPTHAITPTTKMTKAELVKEIHHAHEHIQEMEAQIKNLERYKQYEDMANEMKAMHTAFMNSGFSDEQAFEMMKMLVGPTVSSALRGMGL